MSDKTNTIHYSCEGCGYRKVLSLHGGDMPTTYVCINDEYCLFQSKKKDFKEVLKEVHDTYKKFVIDSDELETVNSIIVVYDDGSILVHGKGNLVDREEL